MLISYRWIAEILGTDPGAGVLADKLTAGGLEVEGVEHVGANLKSVKFARVLGSRAHPTSKNPLTLVSVDIGDGTPVEVVCGAPNVPAPGGIVCFAPIGTRLFDKKGVAFTLEAKPIAGIVSQGMLCAEDELGLGNDHAGILVFELGTPGASLASLSGIEDSILSLNVTANRPDALGHIGVARDAAALLGIPFRQPAIAPPKRLEPARAELAPEVRIEDAERCPRFGAAVVAGVTVGPSPLWMRVRLHRLGIRPISNVVDVTNFVMLEFGQPMHAYDSRHVAKNTLIVRRARDGEKLKTLDGIDRALVADDLVIADHEHILGLAGVMGGDGSGVSETTKNILLESAYFEPRGVRRSAKRYAMHTEASHRFEREVDVSAGPNALARAVSLLTETAGGTAVGDRIDAYPQPRTMRKVDVRPSRVKLVLGIEVPIGAMKASLSALGFNVLEAQNDIVRTEVPFHRPDVKREVDLIEEVGRVFGYDKIPSVLPPTSGARAGSVRDFTLRRLVRERFAALGLDEAIGFAFVSPAEVKAAGFGSLAAVRITNPMSEERSLLRPALLPRLFVSAGHAQRYGVPRVRLFEVGTTFSRENPDESGLARETTHAAIVIAGPRDAYLTRPTDVDFFDAKGLLEGLVDGLTRDPLRFEAIEADAPEWVHPRRSARVKLGDQVLGVVGEVHPDVREAFGLPSAIVAAEIVIGPIGAALSTPVARAPGKFPTVRRDVALLVERKYPAGDIAEVLRARAGECCDGAELFDRYEGKELPAGTHSLAFALWFRSDVRTLTDEEVDRWTTAAVEAASSQFHARQR